MPFCRKCALLLMLFETQACRHGALGQPVVAQNCPSAARPTPASPAKSECGMPARLQQPEWPRKLTGTLARELEPAPRGSVTLALLPDTQYYSSCRYPHLEHQSEWIASQRTERNILAAISLGDLTDDNSEQEWAFVRESTQALNDGFPLLLTTGNHDVGTNGTTDHRETLLSRYFTQSWANQSGALRAVMRPGQIENAFYSFELTRFRLGVLMLEWSPRQATVEWANQVLTQYSDHRVVIATHAYLYDDSTRYDRVRRGKTQLWSPFDYGTGQGVQTSDGSHDGEMLWNALVRRHPGVFLVVSGHVLNQGTGRSTSRGDAGNSVHQVLVNYQMLDQGGLGYLRLLEIHPDGRTLHMKTYSPSLGVFSYAAEQDFRLEVEPPLFLDTLAVTQR